jgi:hypothetical protein
MGRWLERIGRGERLLWLNDTSYAARLLVNDHIPWGETGAVAHWRSQAMRLLEPDIALLDLVALANSWPSTRGSVGGAGEGELLELPANEAFRLHVVSILAALRAITPKPLALEIPSPRRWFADAAQSASNIPDPSEDTVEDCAGEWSRFLRSLSDVGLDVILLREYGGSAAEVRAYLGCYTSLVNTAHHYRWDIGIQLPDPDSLPPTSFDFAVAARNATGVALDDAFWAGAAAPALPMPGFYYATVPADAQPVNVLARLRSLS